MKRTPETPAISAHPPNIVKATGCKKKRKTNVDSSKIRFAARRIQSVRYHSLTWPSSGGERCIFFFYTLIFGISLSGWLVVLVIYSYPKAKSGPLDKWIWISISIYGYGYGVFQISNIWFYKYKPARLTIRVLMLWGEKGYRETVTLSSFTSYLCQLCHA